MRRRLGLLALLLCCAACGRAEVGTRPAPAPTPGASPRVEVGQPAAPTKRPAKSCVPGPATVQAMPVPLIPQVPREPLSPE